MTAEQEFSAAESALVWSAATCSAKCALLADAYRDLDFEAVEQHSRDLRGEQGRLAEAKIKAAEAKKRWKAARNREIA